MADQNAIFQNSFYVGNMFVAMLYGGPPLRALLSLRTEETRWESHDANLFGQSPANVVRMHILERMAHKRIVPALASDPPAWRKPLSEQGVPMLDRARHLLHEVAELRDQRCESDLWWTRGAYLEGVQRRA